MPLLLSPSRQIQTLQETGQYLLCFASHEQDLHDLQALRFRVFNLELNEGLRESYQTGRDADVFDPVCDHLMVIHRATGEVVGTYRMQTGVLAAAHFGYYSATEFDLQPFEPFRNEIVELGRACIDRRHRNVSVLSLLWRGIVIYAKERGLRYLMGCSSLTSQDPALGWGLYHALEETNLPSSEWRTRPLPHMEMPEVSDCVQSPKPPRLFAAYLALGAKVCSTPAIDRDFQTIDYLTVLDLQGLEASAARRFLGHQL